MSLRRNVIESVAFNCEQLAEFKVNFIASHQLIKIILWTRALSEASKQTKFQSCYPRPRNKTNQFKLNMTC